MVIEDLEKIKELDTEKKILQDIIRSYSTYKTKDIAEIIAIIMKEFEGIEYICINDTWYKGTGEEYFENLSLHKNNSGYQIVPLDSHNSKYARYKIKNIDNNNETCMLLPSNYTPYKKCSYVQDFINYLYVKRREKDVVNNDRDFLVKIALEFIEKNSSKISKRREKISNKPKVENSAKQKRIQGIYYMHLSEY